MQYQRTTKTKPRLLSALTASLVASLIATAGAQGATFTTNDSNIGGFFDWNEEIGPDETPGLPGGFEVDDNGEPDPPPGGPRAHSDVPDLPDSNDPPPENATANGGDSTGPNTGNGLYEPPQVPGLKDIIFDSQAFTDSLESFTEPLPQDSGGYGTSGGMPHIAPAVSTIPAPSGALILTLAGAGLARRRRRH